MRYVIRGMEVLISLIMLIGLFLLCRDNRTPGKLLTAYHEFAAFLREKEHASSWYQKRTKWLQRNGACFHYGTRVEPLRFLVLELSLGLTGIVVGNKIHIIVGLAAFGGMFFLPSGLLVMLNKRDNERMLPEIKLVYHALEIQTRAGVYVTDALAECYGSVTERRLKSALLELAGDIVLQADIVASLDKFQGKFDNPYIDSLCLTILQALESGQAVELLRDIGEQIKDMEQVVLERRKAGLDRGVTFCQLGVLAVLLGVALYACVSSMFGTISKI